MPISAKKPCYQHINMSNMMVDALFLDLRSKRDQLFLVLLAIAASARNVSAITRVTTTIMKP